MNTTERWMKKHAAPLTGKRIALTGATGGLGSEWCRYLAQCGGTLILLTRSAEKTRALTDALKAACPTVAVEHIPVDLEDMGSVKAACDALRAGGVDILIHNAGAYAIPRRRCENGLDNVFQIDFMAPYYMTAALLPHLRERGGQVVAVGSIAHRYAVTDPTDVDFSRRRSSALVYGNAKRTLMLALYELFREETRVGLSVVHPGITFTNITAHYPPWLFRLIKEPMKLIFMPPKKACLSLLAGVFERCGYHEWIGPWLFDVWGHPVRRRLRGFSAQECRRIGETARRLYEEQ